MYRTPIGLSFVSENGQLYIYESKSEKRWPSSLFENALLVGLLAFCTNIRTQGEILEFIAREAQCSVEVAKATLDEIMDSGLLINAEDRHEMPPISRIQKWKNSNWNDALQFHWHTNELIKMDYNADHKGVEDKALMQEYIDKERQPSSYKTLDEAVKIELPEVKIEEQSNFRKVVANELYKNKSSPLNSDDFAWLMKLGFGETGFRVMPVTGRHVGKTAPSGGSRHPTEVYAVILNVDGIEQGVYHYSVKDNALEKIHSGNYEDFIFQNILRHKDRIKFKPSMVLVFTSIFERSMFRYRESRSYRVINYDLGHLMQNTSYLARSLNKNCYKTYSLNEKEVEKILNIDGILESSLAAIAIG